MIDEQEAIIRLRQLVKQVIQDNADYGYEIGKGCGDLAELDEWLDSEYAKM